MQFEENLVIYNDLVYNMNAFEMNKKKKIFLIF